MDPITPEELQRLRAYLARNQGHFDQALPNVQAKADFLGLLGRMRDQLEADLPLNEEEALVLPTALAICGVLLVQDIARDAEAQ